jgi:hypothetical protein
MKKIAILYIATGRYVVFWKDFFKSSEEFLLPNTEKHYFIFTDKDDVFPINKRVHLIKQKKLGWPKDTLMRFSMFLKIEDVLKEFDYIYFFNANLKIVDIIYENDFLPKKESELVVVQHPGFFNKSRDLFDYETNKESLAYIPNNKGEFYIAGGLNGGTASSYLKLIKSINKNTIKDYSKNIIAKWHDESHLNKYIINKKVKLLDAGFLFPEFNNIPFKKKIIVRDKNCVGGHLWLRSDGINLILFINYIISILKYYLKGVKYGSN